MTTVSEAFRSFLARALPPQADSALVDPDAAHDQRARGVTAARRELREAMEQREQARQTVAAAEARLRSVREQLESLAPALVAAQTARDADRDFRQRALLERGELAADSSLAAAADRAVMDLREARRAHSAARAALPVLEERLAESREALKGADLRIDEAIGRVLVALVAERTAEAHELAARLNERFADLASLSHFFAQRGVFNSPPGTVPVDLVPHVVTRFDGAALHDLARPWADLAKRLREDPDAD
jgi:chromosome segregation ATPase